MSTRPRRRRALSQGTAPSFVVGLWAIDVELVKVRETTGVRSSMNTLNRKAPTFLDIEDPAAGLALHTNGHKVIGEAPDGLTLTCVDGESSGGIPLAVGGYRCFVTQRFSAQRGMGAYRAHAQREPTRREIAAVRHALRSYLRALDAGTVTPGQHRIALDVVASLRPQAPEFASLADAAAALAEGRVEAGDIASRGPRRMIARALAEDGTLIAYRTIAEDVERDEFLVRAADGTVRHLCGVKAATEFYLTTPSRLPPSP